MPSLRSPDPATSPSKSPATLSTLTPPDPAIAAPCSAAALTVNTALPLLPAPVDALALLGPDLQRPALDHHFGFIEQAGAALGADAALAAGDDIDLIGAGHRELVERADLIGAADFGPGSRSSASAPTWQAAGEQRDGGGR